MDQVTLKVKRRPTGKQISKRFRKEGLIPGVFYIKGEESIPILADTKSLKPIVYTSHTRVVNLEIEGEKKQHECVLKDITFDPITDKIKHFDLNGFTEGKKMRVSIQITTKGQAIGLRDGGVVQHNLRKVEIYCLPKDLLESIEVDITDLKIGKSIALKDLKIPNIDFGISQDTMIVSCVVPRVSTKDAAKPGTPEAAKAGEATA